MLDTEEREALADNRSLEELIRERFAGMREWLEQNAAKEIAEQKHLDTGSAERAYWHFGYAAALRDVLECLPDHANKLN